MDVVGFSLEEADFCSIEATLSPLTENQDRYAAAKGRMLLELMQHLRKSSLEPLLNAFLTCDEIRMWRSDRQSGVSVEVRVDWFDYGQWEGDLPVMHYRVKIPGLSPEVRSRDLVEVERFLRKAFVSDQE